MPLLEEVLSFGPPLVLIVGMLGVGMSMTGEAAGNIGGRLDRIAAVTVLQVVILPLVGLSTLALTGSVGPTAAAILLISLCPGGGISNLFVLFARANTALSVVLTVTSLLVANFTLPWTIAALATMGYETPVTEAPIFELTIRLVSVVIVPAMIGMLVRRAVPELARVWQSRLREASAVMILVILTLVLWLERTSVAAELGTMVPAAVVFVILALAAGFAAGRLIYDEPGDQFAVMVEFGVRNLAIGTFLAVSLGRDLSFAGPAAVYLLMEAIIILALGMWRRRVC